MRLPPRIMNEKGTRDRVSQRERERERKRKREEKRTEDNVNL